METLSFSPSKSLTAEGKIESPLSHSSTNYSRWYHSNESYEVKNYQDKYEPYLILRCGIIFYHINYSVIQGFPALRKAVTTHLKNYDIFFHVCLISPISCWHVTQLSRHSVRLINERQSFHDSQYKVILSELFRIMAAKTLKKTYRSQTVTFKLS